MNIEHELSHAADLYRLDCHLVDWIGDSIEGKKLVLTASDAIFSTI
jgi:hypothetical protein